MPATGANHIPYGRCTARMHRRIGRRHVDRVIRSVENDVLNDMAVHSPTFALYIDATLTVGEVVGSSCGRLCERIIKK